MKKKKAAYLTILSALCEAATWNRADLRGIDEITPDVPMLKARDSVLRAAVKKERERAMFADVILLFRKDCETAGYTDSGDAWALLNRAEFLLRGS